MRERAKTQAKAKSKEMFLPVYDHKACDVGWGV